MIYTKDNIAAALDLAVLKPNATADDVKCACALANKHRIKSVCVPPIYIPLVVSLHNHASTVIAFPHGNTTPNAKRAEAQWALAQGARELDVVVNYGRFLDGDRDLVRTELQPIVQMAQDGGAKVKAILETCYYPTSMIALACRMCVDAGVDFVKTSTGFGPGGANIDAVTRMLDAVRGTKVQVKASGGIKTYAQAAQYLDMGCTRLGSSSFLELLP